MATNLDYVKKAAQKSTKSNIDYVKKSGANAVDKYKGIQTDKNPVDMTGVFDAAPKTVVPEKKQVQPKKLSDFAGQEIGKPKADPLNLNKQQIDDILKKNAPKEPRKISDFAGQELSQGDGYRLHERYLNFTDAAQRNVANPFFVGAANVTSSTLGAMATSGDWIMRNSIGRVVDAALGTDLRVSKDDPAALAESFRNWVNNTDSEIRKMNGDEKNYMDYVLEGAGSSLPFLAAGAFGAPVAAASRFPKMAMFLLNMGLSGTEAMVNAYDDYRTLLDKGDGSAQEKALASFVANLGVNYVTNKLGFLGEGSTNALKTFLATTLLENGQEMSQSIISGITRGESLSNILSDTVQTGLVSLPISALFGGGAALNTRVNTQASQGVKNTVAEFAQNGATLQETTEVMSVLTGNSPVEVRNYLDSLVAEDAKLQEKFNENAGAPAQSETQIEARAKTIAESAVSSVKQESKQAAISEVKNKQYLHGADTETAAKIRDGGFIASKDFPGYGMVSLTTSDTIAQTYEGGKGEALPIKISETDKVMVFDSMEAYENALEAQQGETGGQKEMALNKDNDVVIIRNGDGKGNDLILAKPDKLQIIEKTKTKTEPTPIAVSQRKEEEEPEREGLTQTQIQKELDTITEKSESQEDFIATLEQNEEWNTKNQDKIDSGELQRRVTLRDLDAVENEDMDVTPRFERVAKEESLRDLITVHNISEDKLKEADRIGGLANPSIAIYDPEKIDFNNFGEITLIATPDLLSSGKIETYASDVYSPRFPRTVDVVAKEDMSRLLDHYAQYEKETKHSTNIFTSESISGELMDSPLAMYDFLKMKDITIPSLKRDDGEVTYYSSREILRKVIETNNLDQQYRDYIQEILNKYNIRKGLVAGYTPSGKVKIKEMTAEEASKIMNKESVRGGENKMTSGSGKMRATVAKRLSSISQIKKLKNKLVSNDAFEDIKNKIEDSLFDLVKKLDPYTTYRDQNQFIETDQKLDAIQAFLEGGKEMQWFDAKFKDVPADLMQELRDFKSALSEMETEYFEAKAKRPVKIEEFSIAIVPENASPETIASLEKKGLTVVKYKDGERGDVIKKAKKDETSPINKAFFEKRDVVGRAANPKEALKVLRDIKERLGLTNLNVEFAHLLFASESTINKPVLARGVTQGDTIVLSSLADRETAFHEVAHYVVEHLSEIDALSGFNKKELFTAVNGGKAYTQAQEEALHEKLAEGYQKFETDRVQAKSSIVQKFYQALHDLLLALYKALGLRKFDVIQDFYHTMATSSGKKAELRMSSFQGPRMKKIGNKTVLDYGTTISDVAPAFELSDGDVSILRGTKGMTADDIMKTYPNIRLTKDVQAKDVYGNKKIIPEGEKLTPYELKDGKILLQDGQTYLVTKNQFQNIKGNSVEATGKPFAPELDGVEETVKGGAIKQTPRMSAKKILDDNGYVFEEGMPGTEGYLTKDGETIESYDDLPANIQKAVNEYVGSADSVREIRALPTKYSSYQLPGGEDYKEILIRAPKKADTLRLQELKAKRDAGNLTKTEQLELANSNLKDETNFKSSHWDELDVISHLRMNKRTYNGKKVAFMEELQSDWAREGREKGFSEQVKIDWRQSENGDLNATHKGKELTITPEGSKFYVYEKSGILGKTADTLEQAKRYAQNHVGFGVPSNSLLKNWQVITVKRALQEAVANDAEYFTWINGEQTSARYSLATHIDDVKWNKTTPKKVFADDVVDKTDIGTLIELKAKGGSNIIINIDKNGVIKDSSTREWWGKKLDEVLGKGLADKIMEKESGTLSGEGLRFGGEWANNLYDKQVKNIVEDLTDAKVETLDLGLPIEKQDLQWFNYDTMKDEGSVLKPDQLRIGKTISNGKGEQYVITDVIGDGKFKAVPQKAFDDEGINPSEMTNSQRKVFNEESSKTFDISTKTAIQQGIKLTPEIKAIIKGEAVEIETSGIMFERLGRDEDLDESIGKAKKYYDERSVDNFEDTVSDIESIAESVSEIESLQNKLTERAVELEIQREILSSHPASQLRKYVARSGDFRGRLPEVNPSRATDSTAMSNVFVREGDSIVTELGYQDSEHARADFDLYLEAILEHRQARKELRNLKSEVREMKRKEKLNEMLISDIEKTIIQRLTGKQFTFKQMSRLTESAQKRGEKVGKRVGAQQMKKIITAQLQNSFNLRLEGLKRSNELSKLRMRIMDRNRDYIREQIVKYAVDNLPVSERGRLLSVINNAKTQSDLVKAFVRIDNQVSEVVRKEMVGDLKKSITKALNSGQIAIDYKEKIQAIANSIDFVKHRKATMERIAELQKVVSQKKARGENVDIPEYVLDQMKILNQKNVADMTQAEIQNLIDGVDLLVTLGRTKLTAISNIREAKKAKWTKELLESVQPIEKRMMETAKVGEKLSMKQRFNNWFSWTMNLAQHINLALTPMDVFFDMLGNGGGTYTSAASRIIKATTDRNYRSYLDRRDAILNPIKTLAGELGLNEGNFDRIGVHAARVQKDGVQKLLDTGFTEQEINDVVLTEKEMQLYNAMRAELDKIRPDIEDVMRKVYNEPLGNVENYFSFVTDFEAMSETEVFQRLSQAEEFGRPRKDPELGYTKKRTGGKQAIKINAMDVFTNHIDNASYLVEIAEDNRIISEIVNSEQFGQVAGDRGQKIASEYMDLVARKGGKKGTEKIAFLDTFRRNVGVAYLGLKLSSAIIQPTALMDGASLIGTWVFRGATEMGTSRDVRKFIMDNFPEVRARIGDDPAYLEMSNNDTLRSVQNAGMFVLKKLDALTASSVAWGAYLKKMKELGQTVDLSVVNKEAAEYAQFIVRKTQASSFFKDAPMAITKGSLSGSVSVDRALLQFQTFIIGRWNLIKYDMIQQGIMRGDIKKALPMVFWLAMAYFAEEGLRRMSSELISLITGVDDEEEDGFTESVAMSVLGTFPFMSQATSIAVYKSDPVPALGALRSATTGIYRAFNASTDESFAKGLVDIGEGLGASLGIPGTKQLGQFVDDAAERFLSEDAKEKRLYEGAIEAFKAGEDIYDISEELMYVISDNPSKTTRSNIQKKIEAYAEFGLDDEVLDVVVSGGANAKKVDALIQKKREVSDTEYRNYVDRLDSAGLLSKDVRSKLRDAEELTNYEYSDGEKTDQKGVIDTVLLYAKAVGTDPVTAFHRIFTGQTIRKIEGGAIIVERMPFIGEGGSEEYAQEKAKELRVDRTQMKLDHTIPLSLGGDNSKSNLKLISTEEWARNTEVEVYLWNLLKQEKISKKDAQEVVKDFKRGLITFQEIRNTYSR